MNNAIFEKAVHALQAWFAEKGGYVFVGPTKDMSKADEEYVYLANRDRSFGKYVIATGEIIMDEE